MPIGVKRLRCIALIMRQQLVLMVWSIACKHCDETETMSHITCFTHGSKLQVMLILGITYSSCRTWVILD